MKDLKQRTREFALRVVRMYAEMPKETVAQVLGKQALRAGTSVALIIANRHGRVQMPSSSASYKLRFKNWMKLVIGLS